MTELHPVFGDLRCVLRPTSNCGFVGEYYYLTDRTIIVRQPCSGHADEDGEFIGVDPISLPWDEPLVGRPMRLPTIDTPPADECESCGGTGTGMKCERCEGRGTVFCDMDHEHKCPECEGGWTHKKEECEDCKGTGAVMGKNPYDMAGLIFDQAYLWALSKNNAQIYPANGESHIHAWDVPGTDVEGFIANMKGGGA